MRTRILTLFLALVSTLPVLGQAELKAALDSTFIVAGEITQLTVYIASPTAPTEQPTIPTVADVSIRLNQTGRNSVRNGNRRETIHIYKYLVQSYKAGRHVIPAFEIKLGNQSHRSQATQIFVHSVEDIEWQTTTAGNTKLRYGSAVFTPNRQPFVGETFPAEVKIYLPIKTVLAERGMAELEHPGLTAWRFEPSKVTGRANLPLGSYNAITYRSTVSALQEGKVSLGPGRARLAFQLTSNVRGFPRWNNIAAVLPLSAREISARPLPPGAPADFKGAVGSFAIAAAAEVENIEEGDPIAVKLAVRGTGNLDSLRAPALTGDLSDWKTYDPSRLERQGERRDINGQVVFSQIIRPLTNQKVIPPFQLSYFDPRKEAYLTVATAAIPFKVIPSKNPVLTNPVLSAADNSIQDMQGILGVVNPFRPQRKPWPFYRYWHLIPAVVLFLLLMHLARKRLSRRTVVPNHHKIMQQALTAVEKGDADRRGFLRAAGHFIEEWIPAEKRDGDLKKILAQRDEECFRPPGESEALPNKERSQVLATLRARALTAVTLLTLFLGAAFTKGAETNELYSQARTAWEDENYKAAAELYRSAHEEGDLPADVEFNLANCHYRLGEPGLASLHYRRAILQRKNHREARQNLRYLEIEQGVIDPIIPSGFPQNLVFLPTSAYREIAFAGLWLSAISICSLVAFRAVTPRVLSWILLPLALLATIYGSVIYLGLTQTESLIPLGELDTPEKISIVTANESLVARTEPRESAPKVISAPPGVPCVHLAERGSWTYLEFADLSRGWLPSAGLRPLLPQKSQK